MSDTPLARLEKAVASVDRLDWRIAREPMGGGWCAWFHPDWQANPVRVWLCEDEDDGPSENEIAAVAALQEVVEHAPALIRLARCVAEEKAAAAEMDKAVTDGQYVGAHTRHTRAVLATNAALADVTKEAKPQ